MTKKSVRPDVRIVCNRCKSLQELYESAAHLNAAKEWAINEHMSQQAYFNLQEVIAQIEQLENIDCTCAYQKQLPV